MAELIKTDILVIGAGSGGLSVAAGAAQMGADTVLIERGRMGGDCLNYGCVPSKSLIAAARTAHIARTGAVFGIHSSGMAARLQAGGGSRLEPADSGIGVDFLRVHDHIHEVIATIAPHDSQERFEGLGVRVLRESARFTAPREVRAGDHIVRARRMVIATGSRPRVPAIAGIDRVPFLTNETIFDNQTLPEHLMIIGAGPIGLEMAQAHRRLGARVTVLSHSRALPKDDPQLAAMVVARLRAEGVDIHEGVEIETLASEGRGIRLAARLNGSRLILEGSHLLVATGRRPNVEDLDLEQGGIDYGPKGIEVDSRLRTSDPKIYAIGDVAGGPQFTHVASYHAGIVIRNALFRLPAKVNYKALPWVTYTDPELAQVGLTLEQARQQRGKVQALDWDFSDNDRAQTERETQGRVRVVVDGRGRILGATIAGARAGELIAPWILAIDRGLKVKHLAGLIIPYPTLGEVNKRAAGSYFTPKLFSSTTRGLVRFL
ncbi:MAG: FAD-dependent oxidoreductase, partial [Candidatus Competibacteraceae bacterium]|nr:FAD-dependent oxidoreductase [Candidatus Competibacteraceae bacterium]